MRARRTMGATAVGALRRATRAWVTAHRAFHADAAWLGRYGPVGPTAPIRTTSGRPPAGGAR